MGVADITFIIPKSYNRLNAIPSLGLPYLAASLSADGFTCALVNGDLLPRRRYMAELQRVESKVVGITSLLHNTTNLFEAVEVLRSSRRDRTIIVGGRGPNSLPPQFLFQTSDIDVLFLGEAEKSLVAFMRAVGRSHLSPRSVPGIVFRENGSLVSTGPPTPIEDLDGLPFPDRVFGQQRDYLRLQKRTMGRPMIRILTTRGCPYPCTYCDKSVLGSRLRFRSARSVVAEVSQTAEEYGCRCFFFNDDHFLASRERIREFCSLVMDRELRIEWKSNARVDSIDTQTARLLRRSGCDQLFFGIESGSQRMLDRMRKGTTVEQAVAALRACRENGIKTFGYFIVGYPGETRDDHRLTAEFVRRGLMNGYDAYTLLPYPGSSLFEELLSRCSEFSWGDYLTWREDDYGRSRKLFVDPDLDFDPTRVRDELLRLGSARVKNRRYFRRSY